MVTLPLLGLLVLGQTAQRSPQEMPITYRSAFQKTDDVVAYLSKATGITLSVAGEVKKYPLYLNVKNVPAAQVLTKIAQATGAEWEQKAGEWVLSASTSLKRQQEKVGDTERIALIQAFLDDANAKIAKLPPITEESARAAQREQEKMMQGVTQKLFSGENLDIKSMVGTYQDKSPAYKATIKILSVLGSKTLAEMQEGRRVVLSTNPTQMQISMPSKAMDVLKKFVDEQRITNRIAKEAAGNQGASLTAGASMAMQIGGLGGANADGNPLNPGPTLLVLSRVGFADSITATITSYDTSGRVIASGNSSILLTPAGATPVITGKTPIKLTPLATEYVVQAASQQGGDMMSRMTTMMSGGPGTRSVTMRMDATPGAKKPATAAPKIKMLSQELSTALQSMDKLDPWSYVGPAILDPLADQKNIIAVIPDVLFEKAVREAADDKSTCESIINSLDNESTLVAKNEGNWLTLTPSSPITYRESYVNRVALSTLLRQTAERGFASLEDVAAFAVAQERMIGASSFGQFHLQMVQRMSGMTSRSMLSVSEFDATRFYGLLTPGQRRELLAGNKLSIRSLDSSQLDALFRVTFDSMFGPSYSKPTDKKGETIMAPGMSAPINLSDLMGGGLDKERTNYLGAGLVPTGTISMTANPSTDTWLARENSSGKIAFGGAELVGLASLSDKMPAAVRAMIPTTKYDSFMKAKTVQYVITVNFTPNVSLTRGYDDFMVDTTRAYTYNEMPSDFKKMAEEIAKQVGGMDFGSMMGGAGQRINP